MKGLDTNILVRFLVKDDEKQSESVYRLFKKTESEKDTFFVPLLVILETIWVLKAVYEILKFDGQPTLKRFLIDSKENSADLSDVLIACSARMSGCKTILSFDKKAVKIGIFELVI